KRLQAEYRKPFICHASIGPSCALARMEGERLEVWSHTQGIFGLRQEIAMVLRLPEERIVVHHAEGAGCYGHNGADDVAIDPPLPAGGAQRNAIPGYDFPDLLVMHHYVREAPVAGSSLRSLGAFGNVYGIESFMDELAIAANAERVEFRLRHLKDPRGRAVIDAAVRKSQWANWKRGEGKGHGIA